MERRTLIRLLVGLAIGIPVLVEAVTVFGLVETRLFGDRDDQSRSPTPGGRRVGVGDELLPDTPQAETVTEAYVRGGDPPWVFVLTVAVENPSDRAYALELRTLTLDTGGTVAGTSSTGRIPAGETGLVTGAWEIPAESTPVELEVVAVTDDADGPTATTATVTLSTPPIRNR